MKSWSAGVSKTASSFSDRLVLDDPFRLPGIVLPDNQENIQSKFQKIAVHLGGAFCILRALLLYRRFRSEWNGLRVLKTEARRAEQL